MSIISEVKCARCDRKYSGVRSRCPYCGARRIGRGKYSEESDNSKGKMLIGVLIMGALVIAVGVLLFTTPAKHGATDPGLSVSNTGDILNAGDNENTEVTGNNPVDPSPPDTSPDITGEQTDSPSPTPAPMVQSVTITYLNKEKKDFTAKIGESVVLGVRIEPVGIDEEVIWKSSNRNVFEVVETNAEKTQAKVTGIGAGTATLTVTVGGIEAECIVRVKKK